MKNISVYVHTFGTKIWIKFVITINYFDICISTHMTTCARQKTFAQLYNPITR